MIIRLLVFHPPLHIFPIHSPYWFVFPKTLPSVSAPRRLDLHGRSLPSVTLFIPLSITEAPRVVKPSSSGDPEGQLAAHWCRRSKLDLKDGRVDGPQWHNHPVSGWNPATGPLSWSRRFRVWDQALRLSVSTWVHHKSANIAASLSGIFCIWSHESLIVSLQQIKLPAENARLSVWLL